MTAVQSKLENQFIWEDINKEIRYMQKQTGQRKLFVGISPTGYKISVNEDDTKEYPIRITSLNKRG